MNDLPTVDIYTDGACSGNPGPGGWGVLLRYNDHERELMGGELDTTNNRMELTAAIMALENLKRHAHVNIHTDSTYLRDGITKWIHNWKANGWKTAAKKPVKNVDLWQRLEAPSLVRCSSSKVIIFFFFNSLQNFAQVCLVELGLMS